MGNITVPMGKYTKIKTGKLDANASSNNGAYPFFTCSREPLKISSFSYDCECVLVAGNGDLNVKYYYGKFDAYQRTYIIESIDKQILDTKYLYYFLDKYVEKLREQSIGGVIKYIKLGYLKDAQILLPPLRKQQQIVDVLNGANALIEKRKAQIEKLDLLMKSQFIEMFGDPVTNPLGWEKISLSKACTKITDGTHHSPENNELGEYMYVTAKNIKENEIDLKNITYVSREIHESIYSRCNPEYGDILYIKDGATTGIAKVNTIKQPFSMLSSLALLKPNKVLLKASYLAASLNNKRMYLYIRQQMGGAAITRLTITKIENIVIPIPPITLQGKFAIFVQAIETQKALLQQSLDKLEQNYKSLMQKCFRGEIF